MNEVGLAGRRMLVVGASSGIGHATARLAAASGARVAIAARRRPLLDELAGAHPESIRAVTLDVRDEASVVRGVADAEASLAGLDDVVYSVGLVPLAANADANAARWRETLETNVVGAALVARAAMPALERSRGRLLFVSSISSREDPPRRGLALYMTSKIALERVAEVLAAEHPEVASGWHRVGDTITGIWEGEQPEQIQRFVGEWMEGGYLSTKPNLPEESAQEVLAALAALR